jgi:hypothetical protein
VPNTKSSPLIVVLLATSLLIGACLLLVGCADEPDRERETGSITTGSTSTPTRTTIVRSGDTIFSIARRNNVTVYDLATSNNLSSTRVRVGQTLSVPSY